MCLPKYCWVCCWNCSVDSGAKFFAIFRIMIAIFQIVSIMEALVTTRVQIQFESLEYSIRDSNIMKELGYYNDDLQEGSDIGEAAKQMVFTITMLLLASCLLYALIELIVASLAVHGMRRARPNMLLPYIIWTSFLAFIAFAFVALLVVSFVFGMFYLDEVKESPNVKLDDNFVIIIIVVFIIFGIALGLMFAWILWDLLIMSSRHRQLKNAIGMDHIMLQEVPNDEKEKFLYPQLT